MQEEVDTLTAMVVLNTGVSTDPVEVDLRDGIGPVGAVHGTSPSGQIHVKTWQERPNSTYERNRPKNQITFNVKTLDKNNPRTIYMKPDKYVSELKETISEKTGIPKNAFFLQNGKDKKLEDQRPFSYYGFGNQANVEMKLKTTRGG